VLRIFVTTLLFGHAVAMTTAFGPTSASSRPLLIAGGARRRVLVLLPTMLWPPACDRCADAPWRSTLPWYQPSSISASRRPPAGIRLPAADPMRVFISASAP
jgi:hypothetical protein